MDAKKLLEQLRAMDGPKREPATIPQAATQNYAERLTGGLLNIPEFAARGARGGANLLRAATGNEMQPIPQGGLLGLPTGREALASLDVGAQSLLSGNFDGMGERVAQEVTRRNQVQTDRPIAAFGGDVLADASTLMAGRAPFLPKGARQSTDIVAPILNKQFREVFNSKAAKTLSKVAGRAIEGGLEGAALSIVQGGDPIETAAMGGASQLAGMAGLKISQIDGLTDLLRGNIYKGGKRLAATAVAVGSLIQVLKSSTPGGKDFILESIETGFDKIPLAIVVGALSGMTGAGRVKGKLPVLKDSQLPAALTDAMTTIPRAGTITLLRQLTEEDQSGVGVQTLNKIISEPRAFGEDLLNDLSGSIEDGTYMSTVNRLLEENEQFRKIMSAPPGLAGVPVKDEDE